MKNAHVLISWVAGAIGLPNLLAQFYTYTLNKVDFIKLVLHSIKFFSLILIVKMNKKQYVQSNKCGILRVIN